MRLRSPKGLTAEDEANAAMLISGAKKQGEYNVLEDTGADIEADAAAKKIQAEELAKEKSGQMAGALETINGYAAQISTLKKAGKAIRDGAETGWISQWLPTFTKATADLEMAARDMGIENINRATFGALSEKELELAMKVGLDLSLDEDVLLAQIEERVAAMEKLQQEMRKYRSFLANNATIDQWLEKQEELYGKPKKTREEILNKYGIGPK